MIPPAIFTSDFPLTSSRSGIVHPGTLGSGPGPPAGWAEPFRDVNLPWNPEESEGGTQRTVAMATAEAVCIGGARQGRE